MRNPFSWIHNPAFRGISKQHMNNFLMTPIRRARKITTATSKQKHGWAVSYLAHDKNEKRGSENIVPSRGIHHRLNYTLHCNFCKQIFPLRRVTTMQWKQKVEYFSQPCTKNISSWQLRSFSSQICDKSANDADPFSSVKQEIADMLRDIKEELRTPIGNLENCSNYYFDGQGKYIRPTTIFLAGRLCNVHNNKERDLTYAQKRIAMISEMIHTASLLHDDVIDEATTRRGKKSVNMVFTDKQTILAGDYILSKSSIALARLGNCRAVELIAEIIEDLVKGEIMQLYITDDPKKRFDDYIDKTYRKTASLIANSCKAAAVLGDADEEVQDILFRFGKNIGIAFQLVDDALDFTSTPVDLGKPVTADLSLGLATAPVLYAAETFPELEPLILRRFSEEGDVQKACHFVHKSKGISQTLNLASEYIKEAVESINLLRPSSERDCLVDLANFVLKRKK